MKITILSVAYPYRGGIANFTNQLFGELRGTQEVNIINFKRQYPKFLFPGKTQFEDASALADISSEMLLDSMNPLSWYSVGKKIRKDCPDLLVINFWLPFFAPAFGKVASIVRKNLHTRIVIICHNVVPHEMKLGDRPLTKYLFKQADDFVVMSDTVRQDLVKLKPDARLKLLFHPVYSSFGDSLPKEDAKKMLGLEGQERIILFFGFIRRYKGLDTLLHAMAELKNDLNVKLLVAGEFYSDQEKYKRLVNTLKIKDCVFLKNNFIPQEDVRLYFSACDAVVLPYRDATQSGIVQLANNFLKPVIATRVGGLAESVRDGVTGLLVKKENSKELAEAIVKYYKENKEAEFAENIRLNLENYSWARFAENILSF